ncbi:MAG: nitrous oxide reductase accessory protein NosL [Pyrobaculum sp.]
MKIVVPLLVAIVVGVAAYLAGTATAPAKVVTQTVATTVTQTVTTTETATVTQTVAKPVPLLEQLVKNGTFERRCIFCGMDVAEAVKMGVSARVIFDKGVAARTDDIGCIFRMQLIPIEKWRFLARLNATVDDIKNVLGGVKQVLVPDYEAHRRGVELYVDAKRAYYVILQDRKTPMGDCVFAFSNPDDAKKHNATIYTFDQMLQLYREVMQKTGMPRPNWCRGAATHTH